MDYPYEENFRQYCKTERHYADSTLLIVSRSLITFWNYLKNGLENLKINDVKSTDIQRFLDSLETELHLKENTINKYLSHIRLYFTFLYSHGLIDHYPMLEINGRKFNRQRIYIVDWIDHLPEIAKIKDIHFETVMMMLGIAQGFFPDEVLKLRYSQVITPIKNADLRNYIKANLDFTNDSDPYILGKKYGGTYPTDFHLAQKLVPDRKLIGMSITLSTLRLSFVYSILNQKDLTDAQLEKILRVNTKTLYYYRQNMMLYNKLIEFKLSSKK